MNDFNRFAQAVQQRFDTLAMEQRLFVTEVDKDALWDTYLASFPPGTNPLFRERTEHDCGACRQFIRSLGNVVSITSTHPQAPELRTLWEVSVPEPYQTVANALDALVKSNPVGNVFLSPLPTAGQLTNIEVLENGQTLTWNHLFARIPGNYVQPTIQANQTLSQMRSSYEVFLRGLVELKKEDIDTVLELISQNSLYRGEEFASLLKRFRELKVVFDQMDNRTSQELFPWQYVTQESYLGVCRLRNSVIGTLLVDLAEGKDLDTAVSAYETKVAPTNYKRPTALVTKGMIEQAQKTLEVLNLNNSLGRRYAVAEDLTINNVLFADRAAQQTLARTGTDAVLDTLLTEASARTIPKNLSKVETVGIDTFLTDILPKATSLELFLENKHHNNLVSLIAPTDPQATPLFKWPNGFSWSYNGEVADSIKERVKKAGGKVDGDLRCSLSWFNYDDLDLHLREPGRRTIYYMDRTSSRTGGNLDVDMNAGRKQTREPVENICYPDRSRMREGVYVLKVHNFNQRETKDVGFEVEIEFDGTIHLFRYDKAVRDREFVEVARFSYFHKEGLKILKSLPSSEVSRSHWGLPTQQFHRVSLVLNSPNHWDNHAVGNKHVFFMLEGCRNDQPTRGFYNEFLRSDLEANRKVFEVLGSRMKVEPSDRQLSGVGFSTTQRNEVLVKVKGSFNRVLKVTF